MAKRICFFCCFFWYNFEPTTAERLTGGLWLSRLAFPTTRTSSVCAGTSWRGSRYAWGEDRFAGDAPGFVEKLHRDRYFAMDFWALVGSLEGMSDRISEEQIRRAVVDCVCGNWLSTAILQWWGSNGSLTLHVSATGGSAADGARAGRGVPGEPGLRIVEYVEHVDPMSRWSNANPAAAGPEHAACSDIILNGLESSYSQRELRWWSSEMTL